MAIGVGDTLLVFNSSQKTMTVWDFKGLCLVQKSMYLISTMPKMLGQPGHVYSKFEHVPLSTQLEA